MSSMYECDDDYCKTNADAVAILIGMLLPVIAIVAFLAWLFW